MTEARLRAKLWVQAALRFCQTMGLNATVIRHGDDDAGDILIKQNLMGAGFCVLSQIRNGTGEKGWMSGTGTVDEKQADAYITRRIDRDSDIWVIEIEDRNGRLPFDEPMM